MAYLDAFEASGWKTMLECHPVWRSLHLYLLSQSYLHAEDGRLNFKSPFWHLQHQQPRPELTYLRTDVLALLKFDVTHTLFGMDYFKLMELPIGDFNQLRQEVEKVVTERNKIAAPLTRQQEKLEQELDKDAMA